MPRRNRVSRATAVAEAGLVATGAAGDPGFDEPDGLTVGDVLDQTYDVEAPISHGGMGMVHEVRHRALARRLREVVRTLQEQVCGGPLETIGRISRVK